MRSMLRLRSLFYPVKVAIAHRHLGVPPMVGASIWNLGARSILAKAQSNVASRCIMGELAVPLILAAAGNRRRLRPLVMIATAYRLAATVSMPLSCAVA